MRTSAKNYTNRFLPLLLLSVLLFAACADSNNTNNANLNVNQNTKTSVPAKDDVGELSALVNLPLLPDEKEGERADWREENVDQKGKKLTAILKYSDANTAKIIEQVEKQKPSAPVEIGVEEWYPAELTAQTQLSGNESLKGVAYEAKDFYNAPYNRGRLIKIDESNFFVLELTTY